MPTVITKKSTVAAKVPLDTDLQVGELAVNTADKILYSKHSDNQVVKIGFDPAVPGPIGSTTPSTVAATNVTVSGTIASPTSIQFGNGSTTSLAAGKAWYDETTGSFNLGMGGGNITQQIGEEVFTYGKASSAITGQTFLQAIYRTGAVGASGVITFAPVTSGITDANLIIGVGTEDIALNGFGRITSVGVVRGINTSGSTYSETWSDNDTIWYKASTGGLTNIKPTNGVLVSVGSIILANASTGSIQVKVQVSSVTDLASPGAIGGTMPSTVNATTVTATGATVAGGTITASAAAFTVTQTRNSAGTTFEGALLVDTTETASASGSLIANFKAGGVAKANVRKDGQLSYTNTLRSLDNVCNIYTTDGLIANLSYDTQFYKDVKLNKTSAVISGYGGDAAAGKAPLTVQGANCGNGQDGVTGLTLHGGNASSNASTNITGGITILRGGDGSSGSAGAAHGGPVHIAGGRAYGTGTDATVNLAYTGTATRGAVKCWGPLTLASSLSLALSAKTADYTLTANDGTITADSTSASITLTLETAVGHTRIHAFKKVAGVNLVTIDGNASETIDGATSITLTDRCILQSNGTEWKQIA